MNHQRRNINLGIATTLLFPLAARAQTYPSRPIRMIVPFAPGGTTEALAKLIAQNLPALIGQQVSIDNRPGASGNVGTDMAAKSSPDGYTIVMTYDGTMTINPH